MEKQTTEKSQFAFAKRSGNTTYKVQVHVVENTTQKNEVQKEKQKMAKSQRSIEECISEKKVQYEQQGKENLRIR